MYKARSFFQILAADIDPAKKFLEDQGYEVSDQAHKCICFVHTNKIPLSKEAVRKFQWKRRDVTEIWYFDEATLAKVVQTGFMLGSLYIPVVPLVQGSKKDRARYQAERIAYLKEVYPLDIPIDAGFQRNRVNSMDEEKLK